MLVTHSEPPDDSGACNAPLPQPDDLGALRRDWPQRRSVRLPGYDYSRAGWYFVTIMAQNGQPLFGQMTAEAQLQPTPLGEVVSQAWHELTAQYAQVHADCWVLMPTHVHLLIGLLPAALPKSLGQLVGAFKANSTRRARSWRSAEGSLWQRSYHEHVIRTAQELEIYRDYVRNNPRRWVEKRLRS